MGGVQLIWQAHVLLLRHIHERPALNTLLLGCCLDAHAQLRLGKLQLLPGPGRGLCHKLLWPVGEEGIQQSSGGKYRAAERPRIRHTQLLPGGLQGLILNPVFHQNLRTALLGGGKAWSDDTSQLGPDKHARDVPSLDKYAEERWEVVLHFMAGSPSAAFLLLDTPAQLWYFMLQHLQTAQSRGMDLVEILSFLFQLSFSSLGKDYSVEGMSDSRREFGLVFQRKRKSRRYYPTRLAISLSSGVSGAGGTAHQPGFIVVETNYQLYAYTESELQIALIALFSEMLYRFPNMVVAQTPVLPPTITDQIRLWELERDRLLFTEGVLYNQFLSQVDFDLLLARAWELGALVFENMAKQLMVVTPAGHREVKRFWKQQKHSP
ncbi:General transcription factor IIH subunit 4 [Myotis davidii]|uniref:General transcription factor IIH subunit 4 n=1 Tax=Myotis davidii TaxID=225400 RepID=L5LPF7_MYODS|nr:General transcription factor IIH subunit 4 [Myotis davidii]